MLSQTEQILQATVEALQRVGLAGFSLHLHVFDHYKTSVTNELGREAIEAGYHIIPHAPDNPENTTTGLIKEMGNTERGEWEVSIYVRDDYPTSILNALSIVSDHIERLAEIV